MILMKINLLQYAECEAILEQKYINWHIGKNSDTGKKKTRVILSTNPNSSALSILMTSRPLSPLQTCLLLYRLKSGPASPTSPHGCLAVSWSSRWLKQSCDSSSPTWFLHLRRQCHYSACHSGLQHGYCLQRAVRLGRFRHFKPA